MLLESATGRELQARFLTSCRPPTAQSGCQPIRIGYRERRLDLCGGLQVVRLGGLAEKLLEQAMVAAVDRLGGLGNRLFPLLLEFRKLAVILRRGKSRRSKKREGE
jgi:hypothetical protein